MWRSDQPLSGPLTAGPDDINALNRVFSDSFTERYRRDGLSGIRVPYLNPAVWQFAMADAGDGAMLWRDARGDLVAFNIVHQSGSEGWMGPLAVRTDRQGHGHGQAIVRRGIEWLQAHGATTIGLETMPRTVDNIGFYSRLGFVPNPLTVTLQRERLRSTGRTRSGSGLIGRSPDECATVVAECRELADQIMAGVDFTREIELTIAQHLGDVTLVRDPLGRLDGFALWHAVPLAQGRSHEDARILKLVARETAHAIAVIDATAAAAASQGLCRLSVRCQTRHGELYSALVALGYRVQWTDLRMTLAGHAEAPCHGVMLSNWEI